MRKLFTVLGLFALVYFITYWSLFTIDIIKVNQESDYLRGVIGAFLGALFAFIFFVGGKFVEKIYINSIDHRNALVRLEYSLSRFMAINFDNIFLIDVLLNSINKNILNKPNFMQLKIDENIMTNLKNINMVNDVHNLYVDIYKQNHSLETVSDFYNELRRMLIKKEINQETFDFNIKRAFREDLIKMKKSLQQLDKKMEIVSSKCIALSNKDEFAVTWLIGLLSVDRKYSKNFDESYKKQLEILQKGRQDNYNESLKELKKMGVDN